MSHFLSASPLWAQMLVLVIIPTIIAASGPILLRRWCGYERLASNNEIAGFKFATVGVVYSVMVAFAVIVVWEKFNDAELTVVQEGGAAATLYRLSAGPEPEVVATRRALDVYLKTVVDQEWPKMAEGESSREATRALDALYGVVLHLASSGLRPPAILSEAFRQVDVITQARRVRLHLATGVVPGIVWLVLCAGAVLTVAFTFFFGTKNLQAQAMMTAVLSALVFMALMVIVSIDHPFTGPSSVGSEPLQRVADDFTVIP